MECPPAAGDGPFHCNRPSSTAEMRVGAAGATMASDRARAVTRPITVTTPISVLDLVPVRSGSTAGEAIRDAVTLAQLADRLGFVRYWFAEHHAMPGIASSAPEILIEHIASATERIRVGSGGIMLPNHTPLRIAEIF